MVEPLGLTLCLQLSYVFKSRKGYIDVIDRLFLWSFSYALHLFSEKSGALGAACPHCTQPLRLSVLAFALGPAL
jgi:hypothetical protein